MRAATLLALLAGVLQSAPAPRLGQDVYIGEPTQGPVIGLLATVTVASGVEGDVVALGGDVVVTEGGAVRGDVVAVAGKVRVTGAVDGRVVEGRSRTVLAPLAGDSARATRSVWGKHLVHMGAWLAVVGGIALALPRPARRGGEQLAQRPLAVLAAGVLALVIWVAVVGIGLLLGSSAAGAGVVMAATGALVAVKVLGVAAVAFWLGARVLPLLPVGLRGEAPRAGVGMAIVLLLALLPVAGEVLWLAANVAGIGAVIVVAVTDGLPLAVRTLSLRRSSV